MVNISVLSFYIEVVLTLFSGIFRHWCIRYIPCPVYYHIPESTNTLVSLNMQSPYLRHNKHCQKWDSLNSILNTFSLDLHGSAVPNSISGWLSARLQ